LLTSAIIARLLSRGPDSLSESRKRGCVVATAEKSEQRLPVFSFAVFLGVYSNFYVFPTHCVIFWLLWSVLLANFCNYRPHVVMRPLNMLSEWLKRGRGMLTAEKRGSTFAVFP